jgi:Zn-dependent protease
VLFVEPPASQGDLHFRIAGIPVRIHPMFWLVAVLLGLRHDGEGTPPAELLIWIAAMLVSIVVHELGHALLQRHYGGQPWITLYGFGGLASCDDCDRSPGSQILISLAGPFAGFALALAVGLLLGSTGHAVGWSNQWPAGMEIRGFSLLGRVFYWNPPQGHAAQLIVGDLLAINIYWGLMNLLPVYPLDGGRISREVCQVTLGAQRGVVNSLVISMVVSGGMALVAISRGSFVLGILFGYLAYGSFRTWEAYRAHLG